MSNLATIVNNILADSGIDDINVVVTNGSYSNPAWITALSWSKITSTPTTLSGYGITDAVPSSRTITINGVTQDLSANRSWTITAGVSSVNAGTGISVNQTTGAVTVTNTGVLVNDITSSSGQGRFGGWYQGNGYTGPALEVGYSGGAGNIIAYDRSGGGYQPLYITGSNLYLRQSGGLVWTNSQLVRESAGVGWLSGNYASSETASTTGAIYSIGGSYYPTGSVLNTMYGVGYTHSAQGQMISGASSWGFYVTGNGTVRVWLGGDNGNIIASGDIYANTSSIVATRTWVNSQGFITGGPYLPLSGGTLSGNLTISGFQNPHITLTSTGGSYSYLELYDGSTYGYIIKNVTNSTSNGVIAGALYLYTDNSKPTQIVHNGVSNAAFLSGGDVYIRGQVYVGGNGASTGTQLVYNSGTWGISITGNADTVDGYHATNAASGLAYYASNGYLYAPSWINVDNGGIFSSTNSAHFRPNPGSYGSWLITGTRNGYAGIEFESLSNGNVNLMVYANSNETGFHNNSYGWQFRWGGGTLYVYKNNYGGGTGATVLDSSNYNSYAPTLTGGGASGTWGINVTGSAGSTQTLALTSLGNGSVNVNNPNTAVYRTENGSGAALAYSPVLHVGGGDTMWQVQGTYGTSGNGTFYFRQGYNGSWGNWLTMLSSANYNSYSPTLTGGGASGTWGINISGNAASASYTQLLDDVNNYTWSSSSLPQDFSLGMQLSFVGPSAGEGAWQNYGTVINARTYAGGGGSLQIYVPYGPNNGGPALQVRFGDYSAPTYGNQWTAWKTLLQSDNFGSYALPLSGGTMTGLITSNVTDEAFRAQSNGTSTAWRGRLGSFNSTADKSSFLGNYTGRPGVFGHNNALTAWAELYVNTLGVYGQGTLYLSWDTYVKGNGNDTNYPILHSGNYNSYAPTLTGGGASGTWSINITGISSQVTINYNNDSNSTYQMLWGSGNSVYGTAGIYCNPYSDTIYSYAYRGNGNVAGTGEATYHPAGIYSTGTNWLYGTMYLNVNPIYDTGDIRTYNSSYFFRARYTAGSDIYHGSLNWYGLQLGNNGDNYIVAGRTNTGGQFRFYVNNTTDFTSINGTLAAMMFSTGRTAFGGSTDSGYMLTVYGDFYTTGGGWIRVSGNQGLYFESYGGGWRMTDSSYIRSYNGKALSMEGASVDYVSSIYMNGGVYIQTYNDRNLIVKSTGYSDAGILGRGSGNQFAFQVYGSGGDYGFLNSAWGSWDIRKTVSGAIYTNNQSSYYLFPDSSTVGASINGAILSNSSFGTNGWGASSNAAAGRVYGPKGAAYSYSGGTIYGAIKIRLPFRNSDGMWSMKVRIYNYAQQQTSEYLIGNYSYSQGAYNWSATYYGGSSSNAFTVRFGNDGSYDCVWIGETGTGWSYPVVSVMDFMMGYSNGNVSNYYQNWDISIVGSLGTVGATITPDIKFGNAFASYYYDSADSTYYVRPSSLSYMYTVSSFYLQNNYDVSTNHDYGIYFANSRSTAYAIFRESGAWNYPYPDLRIAFHTGIKIGANASYQGVRFYTDYDMSTLVLSVNNGDYNSGGIYVHGTAYASAYYETSDARVKKILEDNSRVNGIESIKPKLYEKDGKTEFGYIAQDFLEIMPYAINNDNKDGYYSLVYREVHTAKIAYLEDSIEEIKAKILYLENQLKTKQ